MSNELFVGLLGVSLGTLLTWGFQVLPQEKWQFLAVLPGKHLEKDRWQGVNLTTYGLFNALAHMIAVALLFILTGAVGISQDKILLIMLVLMSMCLPASRLFARWIEKKEHTATVGGASFVGIIMGPASVWVVYHLGYPNEVIPWLPLLAALAVAYAAGEGVGRLACISFGCCYGIPLADGHPLVTRLFRRFAFVFTGATKKIAYESGLEGQQILPIQAITSIIFIGTSLTATYQFLRGNYEISFYITILFTQCWRLLSELFRADYRGSGYLSSYQVMALLTLPYTLALCLFLPPTALGTDIAQGLQSLWHPGTLLFLQAWGIGIFWYAGRSRVTGSHLSFHIFNDRI